MEQKNGLILSRRGAIGGTLAFGLASSIPARAAGASAISAAIDVSRTGHPISGYMYGGFIEHIGNLINYSFWSEVLDDRKFFHPVDSKPLPAPAGFSRRMMPPPNKWMPVGPDAAVAMDTAAPYVGEHSPVVTLAGRSPRGIGQNNLSLAKKDYIGRIVLAADPGAEIWATLIWGKGAHERQTMKIAAGTGWTKVPLGFACKGNTAAGRIEIVGRGSGTFRVGAVSLMPADNIKGFRSDTMALMKEMNCGILRMPGGNFISGYDWKNTIGDPDRRPPIFDPVWHFPQPNDVGVDELLQMCREILGVEPYWCINTGFGEPRSGGELVEYVNGAATSAWGARRAANGHPEPYKVHYWNVGNEMYGHWQLGHMALDQYTIKHNLFAEAMRKADPTIYVVVPGGFVDEMTTGQGIVANSGGPLVEYGSDRDWAGGMLANCYGRFDALATHAYPPENKHFDLATGKNVDITQTLVEWAQAPAQRVATMADCWEEYKKRFPKLNEGKVKVFFDEWAYHFVQDYKGCLAIARMLHEFFRHSDFIDMAAYTMGMSWLNYDRTHSVVSASGRVFQLYNRHFGRIPVAVTGNAPVPPPKYPPGGDQPKVNTGSATWPLDVSAALTENRRALIVAVVNATDASQTLALRLDGFTSAATGRMWKLAAPGLDAENAVGKPPQVAITEGTFDAANVNQPIPPHGIVLYEFASA
ncbi:MAG TPA: alpha-L-arabinofuranosidase C-terminal domain-containing protein [Rhizomicrobium sp.]|nr:alpha-L-arabinofuranosidase C-terminal domain-containing protein [Rhizomicrobium sp.]